MIDLSSVSAMALGFDFGCGTGENALALAALGLEVVGVDIAPWRPPMRDRVESVADRDGEAREGLFVTALRPSDHLGIHASSA